MLQKTHYIAGYVYVCAVGIGRVSPHIVQGLLLFIYSTPVTTPNPLYINRKSMRTLKTHCQLNAHSHTF